MSAENQTAEVSKEKVTRNYGPKETVNITAVDVIAMLDAGKTRKEIGAHYGLNQPQTAALFNNPKLKGKKTKKQASAAFSLDLSGTESIKDYEPRKKKENGEKAATTSAPSQDATPQEAAPATTEKGAWD